MSDRPDDGGSKALRNVGKLLPDYTVLQPRREPSSICKLHIYNSSILVGRPEGNRHLGRPRCVLVGNIKIDLEGIGMDWI
jgi:hypothetical protein